MAFINNLAFHRQVFLRRMEMLFRKKKRMKLLHFSHVVDADSKDTIILRYKFLNAVYFSTEGKKTFQPRLVVARPEKHKEIILTVHGFYRKSRYAITIEPNNAFIKKIN
jgi:hypothetical protein